MQLYIESKLEKKRKNRYGGPYGRRVLLFIDDINMPQKEQYGAQPPIELLRQCQVRRSAPSFAMPPQRAGPLSSGGLCFVCRSFLAGTTERSSTGAPSTMLAWLRPAHHPEEAARSSARASRGASAFFACRLRASRACGPFSSRLCWEMPRYSWLPDGPLR